MDLAGNKNEETEEKKGEGERDRHTSRGINTKRVTVAGETSRNDRCSGRAPLRVKTNGTDVEHTMASFEGAQTHVEVVKLAGVETGSFSNPRQIFLEPGEQVQGERALRCCRPSEVGKGTLEEKQASLIMLSRPQRREKRLAESATVETQTRRHERLPMTG